MNKPERNIFKLRWIIIIIFVAALVFFLPFVLVWQNVSTVKIAKENERIHRSIETVRACNALLQMDVDAMLSHEQVERTAMEKNGMIYPKPEQVVFVEMKRKNKGPSDKNSFFRKLRRL